MAEIKYRLSTIKIDKKNEAFAKETLENGLDKIDYEAIKQEIEQRFKSVVDNGDYAAVIRIFNEKDLSKSIGHFMRLVDKEYCNTAVGMLRNSVIDVEEVFGTYLPGKDVIPR